MTRTASMIFALTALPVGAMAAPGYLTQTIEVAHRDRPVELHIWYPTDATGETIQLGKNAVFKGTQVQANAAPTSGTHPLVLLSHGSGGNAANLGWIAGALAERGMIVVAPNHPGTTSRDSLQSETVKIWERPADLSGAIDHALSGGLGDLQIDPQRIGAIGFSLGGYTVLGAAGARASKQGYIDYCNQYSGMMDCGWLKAGGVDFNQIDTARYEQSNLDPRIAAVVSVDPALSQAYNASSLRDITLPALLINLGEPATVPAAIDAANLAPLMPNAQIVHVSQGTHFSFLGACTMLGGAIIATTGEGPICSETGSRKRRDIHAELQTTIGDFLSRQLQD